MYFRTGLLALSWALQSVAQTITGSNLRIMPLGDSITVGACGAEGNGYRAELVRLLDGNQVNMIGSFTDGSARDNQYEAAGGYYIDQILHLAQNSLNSKPNVYLVHAGTNNLATLNDAPADCAQPGQGDANDICQKAIVELDKLLRTLFFTNALLVVAQITPSNSPSYNGRIAIYNKLITNLIANYTAKPSDGWKIVVANMQSLVTTSDIDPSCGGDDSNNGNKVHPTPGGYKKMAQVWYNAIAQANQAGLLPAPIQPIAYPQRYCPNVDNSANGAAWCGLSPAYPSRGQTNYFFGVSCSDLSSTMCSCKDSYNNGALFNVTKTQSCAEMSTLFTTATRWADLNGDGRQENVYITPTGALNVSLNNATFQYPNGVFSSYGCGNIRSTFRELGIKTVGPVTKRYQVRLADLDADNRAEYIVVNTDGSATGYWNSGSKSTVLNNIGVNFAASSSIVAPTMGVSGIGVRFVDFDADQRADYVWVGANGELRVWLNKANDANTAHVTSWVSQGVVTPPIFGSTLRENVQIIDLDGDGRADYLVFNRTDGTVGAWLNRKPADGSNVPQWTFVVTATSDQGTAAGVGGFNELHFGDPDGDGYADYLVTNFADSSVQGLRNHCSGKFIN